MSPEVIKLARGFFATAISQTCGLIVGLPALDPDHFNLVSLHGAEHVFAMIGGVVLIGEAHYLKQWSDAILKGNGNGTTAPK